MEKLQEAGRIMISGTPLTKGKDKPDLSKHKARDKELVKGRFNYHELPGGTLEFVYKMPYKGEPVVKYALADGEICRIPAGVARHLNNNVGSYTHAFLLDAAGKPTTSVRTRRRRCSFEPLDFLEIDDIGPRRIEEVESFSLPPLVK